MDITKGREKDGRFEECWKTWGLRRIVSNFEQREKKHWNCLQPLPYLSPLLESRNCQLVTLYRNPFNMARPK